MAKKSGTAQARGGSRGPAGKRGAPGIEPAEIHAIIADIETLHDEAKLQFKRIAQIQVQLDSTLQALKEMGDRAGRQRKRR